MVEQSPRIRPSDIEVESLSAINQVDAANNRNQRVHPEALERALRALADLPHEDFERIVREQRMAQRQGDNGSGVILKRAR